MRSETLDFIIQVLRRSVIAEVYLCGAPGVTLVVLQNFGFFAGGIPYFAMFLLTLAILAGVFAVLFGISHDLLMKKLKIIIREEENDAKKARKRK